MRRELLAVIAAGLACSSPSSPPSPPPPQALSPPAPCTDAPELRAWLAGLYADGQSGEPLDPLKLATLDAYPTPTPDAVRVSIAPCQPSPECHGTEVLVESRGALYGAGERLEQIAARLRDDLRALRERTDMVGELRIALLIDDRTTWRSIAAIIGAIEKAGARELSLAFVAGKTHASEPGPSSIDAQNAAADARAHADPVGTFDRLMTGTEPAPAATAIYQECPQAGRLLADITSGRLATDDKGKAIAELLPRAVVACGCRLEIPALERTLWRLFGRDTSPPIAWVRVALARGGARFEAATTATWSTMHGALVAAARQPLAFE